jgi:hypothetical protein
MHVKLTLLPMIRDNAAIFSYFPMTVVQGMNSTYKLGIIVLQVVHSLFGMMPHISEVTTLKLHWATTD